MILLLGFSCCYIFIFDNENSSKLHIRILGFDKVLHCLSFFFKEQQFSQKLKTKVRNDEASFTCYIFIKLKRFKQN